MRLELLNKAKRCYELHAGGFYRTQDSILAYTRSLYYRALAEEYLIMYTGNVNMLIMVDQETRHMWARKNNNNFFLLCLINTVFEHFLLLFISKTYNL